MPVGTDVDKGSDWDEVYSLSQSGRKLIADAVGGELWDDLRSPATAINPPGQASDPDVNLDGGLDFAAGATNTVIIVSQLPHTYAEGTELRPHIHWHQTSTGDVVWQLEYKWYNNSEAVATGFTTVTTTDKIFSYTTGTLAQMTRFGRVDGAGKRISSMFIAKLSRLGGATGDTCTAAATLTEFDLHYKTTARGSKAEAAKER